MSSNPTVLIRRGALDEIPITEGADAMEVILRGSIDPGSLRNLLTGDYQREVLPMSSLGDLVAAMKAGCTVPDIELGMRGQRYTDVDGVFNLRDEVYIVDGLQRVSAALHVLDSDSDVIPRIGAAIHFGTNEDWERARFEILNAHRTKLSPNVLLRNLHHDNKAVNVLLRMCGDRSFVLHDRVSWSQRQKRSELTTALTFAKVVGTLHSHAGPGRYSRYADVAAGLEKIMSEVGVGVFRDNIRTFFDLVDECWGIKRVVHKDGAVQMRLTFLVALATVLSAHTNFWRDGRLFISATDKRKLAQLSLSDPTIVQLAGSSGHSRDALVFIMMTHINRGRRTGKLVARSAEALPILTDEEIADLESDAA